MKLKFGIKEVVAIGIGTALFVALTEIQIPTPIPNTYLQPRMAIMAFLAAVFGPVVGGIVGLLGHALGDAMFYGSGAGKLPTASAVVGDMVAIAKHIDKNIYLEWEKEKLVLADADQQINQFFVRSCASESEIENIFGNVTFVEIGLDDEIGFVTEPMRECDYHTKAEALGNVRQMIRLGQ